MILALRDNDLVYEVIDDEVILLDLGTGCYYAGNRSATLLVELIVAHPDFEVLLGAIGTMVSPPARAREVSAALNGAVQYLLSEGLLSQREASAGLPPDASLGPDTSRMQALLNHVAEGPPAFEKHTDMQEILLLDPIHDVGHKGWPLSEDPKG